MLKHRHMAPILAEGQAWVTGSYPEFVGQRKPNLVMDFIPIFSSHEVEADEFEAKLNFLKSNGYQTVTSDALVDFVCGRTSKLPKTVMISFDDGRQSVWKYAFPLLKKYGFQATVFLSPDLIGEGDVSKNLNDLWDNKCNREDLLSKRKPASLSWKEVMIMHESGLVDFQCHSLAHRKIPTKQEIVTFLSPDLIDRYYFEFDIPVFFGVDATYPFNHFLGAPIYTSRGFLGAADMLLDDPALRGMCIDYVRTHGQESFFQLKNWEKHLQQVVCEFRKNRRMFPRFENQERKKKRMLDNLTAAKEIIEKKLKNKTVQHLAYPWGEGSEIAVQCSKEAGYISNFWATLPHLSKNQKGSDPYQLVRLKYDFIWRLPGQGRKSLYTIYKDKFFRRARGKLDY